MSNEITLTRGRHAGAYVLERNTYAERNRLAVSLYDTDGPYASLSVNLPNCETIGDEEFAYDMNNLGQELLDDLVEQDIVSLTGLLAYSGFCEYPVVRLLV